MLQKNKSAHRLRIILTVWVIISLLEIILSTYRKSHGRSFSISYPNAQLKWFPALWISMLNTSRYAFLFSDVVHQNISSNDTVINTRWIRQCEEGSNGLLICDLAKCLPGGILEKNENIVTIASELTNIRTASLLNIRQPCHLNQFAVCQLCGDTRYWILVSVLFYKCNKTYNNFRLSIRDLFLLWSGMSPVIPKSNQSMPNSMMTASYIIHEFSLKCHIFSAITSCHIKKLFLIRKAKIQ